MARSWLGLDVGTSAVKAVLVDEARRLVAETQQGYPVSRPHPAWSEQNAEDWWQAVNRCVADLRAKAPAAFAAIGGIGLSGQMHGAVILGADDRPLRPVILWNDGRSHAEAEALYRDNPGLAEEVGVYPMPGFTAPKLLWLRNHEPEVFAAIRHVMLPKDYIRLKLTGSHMSDMSDAAGTWLLDEAARGWSARAAAATGLDTRQLPVLVEGSAPGGQLRAEVAADWGLTPGLIVAGGAGDAAAGGLGIGAINEGDAFLSLGTSGQVFAPTKTYRHAIAPMVHSFCHALPGRWLQMGCMLTGASAFGWAAGLVGQDVGDLDRAVAAAGRGPGDLLFLPYLVGERTPHNDPRARGVFFGLTPETDAVAIGQAVMEGVAYSAADGRDALASAGTVIGTIGLIGGGAKSPVWAQILADVMDRPIRLYRGADKGPAFGAAALARLAVTGEAPEDVCTAPEIEREITPRPAVVDAYVERLERYRALYQATKGLWPGA